MLQNINISSRKRIEFLDITSQVSQVVAKSGIKQGLACLFVPHTTAGITINEAADPSVVKDMITKTNHMVPKDEGYSHMEGNSDAHIKTTLVGPQLNVIIENSELVLGTWQGIYFAEFDGPRNRKLYVKLMQG